MVVLVSGSIAAVRGALAFLTRLPVGTREGDWSAFTETPLAFPLAGYAVGVLVSLPLLGLFVGVPALPVVAAYLFAVYLVTGVNHIDGVADVADAAAVHGSREERRAVLTDTDAGVGAVLAVTLVVVALALGAYAVTDWLVPIRAFGLVVAAEVGAKLGMVTVACLGEATHEGLGQSFTRNADRALLLGPAVVAAPAALLTFASPAALAALVAAPTVAWLVVRWAEVRLGGVSGDAFGAANELGRVAAIHAGVVVGVLV